MSVRAYFLKKQKWLYCAASCLFFLLPLIRIAVLKIKNGLFLVDFCAYCDVSLSLFRGRHPYPDHMELLTIEQWSEVPIVYPGHMILFAPLGYLWGNTLLIAWVVLNIIAIYFIVALTLVKACGFNWQDLWLPGKKQFLYVFCSSCFLASSNAMTTMRIGQIPVILTLCLYAMFWGPDSLVLRAFLFSIIAVTKYSLLTVFAPLLFFKGHWKLCIAGFAIFVFFSISPVFCGNNLVEVYKGYIETLKFSFQPDEINHYATSGMSMCHLGFLKNPILNSLLKSLAIIPILWLFWKERSSSYLSDTLLLLAFSLTMLISYHQFYDFSLIFPLFFIRLFAFAKERNWGLFGVTALFPLFLLVPGTLVLKISSWIGGVPGIGSFIYLVDNPWGKPFLHVFPLMAFYSIALAAWSLYLYLRVKDPYRFELPVTARPASNSEESE